MKRQITDEKKKIHSFLDGKCESGNPETNMLQPETLTRSHCTQRQLLEKIFTLTLFLIYSILVGFARDDVDI